MKKIYFYLALLLSSVFLWGCGGSSNNTHQPQLRAVHLSPDAPQVDIDVSGNTVLEDVAYRQSSNFLSVPVGSTPLQVLVANTSTAVIDETLILNTDTKYTVLAVNNVANIEPLIISDNIEKPANGFAAIRVVHAAPSAPEVDVYVTAPTTDISSQAPLLEDVPFKGISDELEVAAGDYRVRVTLANDNNVIYDSGVIGLVSGVEYVAIAAESDSNTSPIGLTILTDLDSTPFVNAEDPRARVRVVHASSDAPLVDIAVDSANVLEDVPFAVGSDYLLLPPATYNIDVAAAANSQSVINADLSFSPFTDYTVAAVNTLANIEPLVLQDDNSAPAAGNVKVRLVHAAVSAGSVDVYITAPGTDIAGINPTISGFMFKEDSGYLEVPAGDYRVRITLAGTKTVAIDTGSLGLAAGQVRTAFALDPVPGSTDFGVLLLADLN